MALTKQEIAEIRELYERGDMTIKEIAKKTGHSQRTVSRYCKKMDEESASNVFAAIQPHGQTQAISLVSPQETKKAIERGAVVGMLLGDSVKDTMSLFDRNLPVQTRINDGIKGISTLTATMVSAHERLSQVASQYDDEPQQHVRTNRTEIEIDYERLAKEILKAQKKIEMED